MGFQIVFEVLRIQTLCVHLVQLFLIIVDTLTAAGNFQTAEQQVELVCQTRIFSGVHCIERRLRGREMRNKDKVAVECFLCVFADCHFVFRFQIQLVFRTLVAQNFLCFQQGNAGNIPNYRYICFQQFQFKCIMLFQIFHDISQACCFHCHNVIHAVNVTHFKVQTNVFVDMTRCCVLFCTVYRCNFKYAVKECHSSLLVELRGLVQECWFVKVFQMEDIRATLGTLCNDLRGMDLSKSLACHKLAEAAADTFLDAEFRSLADVS